MLYDPARYEYRGKFALTRFNRDCLSQYPQVFKTVCRQASERSPAQAMVVVSRSAQALGARKMVKRLCSLPSPIA